MVICELILKRLFSSQISKAVIERLNPTAYENKKGFHNMQ